MQAEYIKKDFNVNVTAMYVGGTEGHPDLGHVSGSRVWPRSDLRCGISTSHVVNEMATDP